MGAKHLARRLQHFVPSLLLPFQVGYHDNADTHAQYYQDGYVSALLMFVVFMSFGIAATFGNILSTGHEKPVKLHTIEIALSLYLTLGTLMLLMLNCSATLRRKFTGRKAVQPIKPDEVLKTKMLKYLPIAGMLLFVFGVWIVDILRMSAYASCMNEYRTLDNTDLYSEGSAAIFFHIVRALFSAFLVMFVITYQKTEVFFYRSRRMRYVFVIIMSALFWMWLDSQLNHAHDIFETEVQDNVFRDDNFNITCSDALNGTYTETEKCFCKDTGLFRALRDGSKYLYPISVEFCIIAVEFIMYFFFTAKSNETLVNSNSKKNAKHAAEARPRATTKRAHEPQRPSTSSDVVLELKTIPGESSTDDHPTLQHNPSCGSFQFEAFAMGFLDATENSCQACQHIASLTMGENGVTAEMVRASIRIGDNESLSSSRGELNPGYAGSNRGSLQLDNAPITGRSQLDLIPENASVNESLQWDHTAIPVLANPVEHTCDMDPDRVHSLRLDYLSMGPNGNPGPLCVSYRPNIPALPSIVIPSTPGSDSYDVINVPVQNSCGQEDESQTQNSQVADPSSSGGTSAQGSDKDTRTNAKDTSTGSKCKRTNSRDMSTVESGRSTNDEAFERDTDEVVNSIHYTEGEETMGQGSSHSRRSSSQMSSSVSTLQSIRQSCASKWLLLSLSCVYALAYFTFSVAVSSDLDNQTVQTAAIAYLVFKCIYWTVTVIMIWLGFHFSRMFQSKHRGYSSFEMALLVCTFGIFVDRFLSIFAAVSTLKINDSDHESGEDIDDIKKKAGFVIISCILNILEVYMQTSFMFHAVAIEPPKRNDETLKYHKYYSLYKQVLLYLVPFNAAFWVVDSFTVLHPETLHAVQLAYFSARNYKFATHILFPFALFYRFYSCLHFLRIYIKAK